MDAAALRKVIKAHNVVHLENGDGETFEVFDAFSAAKADGKLKLGTDQYDVVIDPSTLTGPDSDKGYTVQDDEGEVWTLTFYAAVAPIP